VDEIAPRAQLVGARGQAAEHGGVVAEVVLPLAGHQDLVLHPFERGGRRRAATDTPLGEGELDDLDEAMTVRLEEVLVAGKGLAEHRHDALEDRGGVDVGHGRDS
jgi:hypothetical protein